MASGGASDDELIAQFVNVTGEDIDIAGYFLSRSGGDLQHALAQYQAAQEDSQGSGAEETGQAQQAAAGPSSNKPPPSSTGAGKKPQKKFATLGDIASAPQVSDEESEDDQDLFAGGEKSGLAVQNPDDLKKKIIEKARKGAPRQGGDDARPQPSNFRGPAQTLGGDDTPSQPVEYPVGQGPPERVERRLHFWSNGFSVDDGELYDTSDPANAEVLNMIRSGRAPLHIMNVRHDQEVDVKVEPHEGPYVAPKKKYKPFSGSGQRLGSPTPGVATSSSTATTSVPTAPTTSASGGSSSTTVAVDSSQPAVSLQIRLGDGSRLVSRFNTTHTIGDIYSFVQASNTASADREWVLMTTFPSNELTNKSLTIGDSPELKKGGTVVQKWT